MRNRMTETKQQKHVCPYCGSDNIAKYIYGLTIYDEELKQQEEGKIIFAGCLIKDDNPKYHCNDCGKDFGKIWW